MEHLRQRQEQLTNLVAELLDEARRQGASAAEAGVSLDAGLTVTVRMGEVETLEHTRDQGLGVTLYFGQRKGSASTSDLGPSAVRETVRAASLIARHTQEDPYAGLAPADRMARDLPDLDLYHPWDLPVKQAIQMALECENQGRHLDPRICNSEGATLGTQSGLHVYANSHGFVGGYPSSWHSLSCAMLGSDGDSMQRDHWWTSARAATELESPAEVGRQAALRTLARLGARRLPTQEAPVLFQADMAISLMRHLVNAIRGSALYREASFLLNQLDQTLFPDWVRIHEQPLLPRGANSSAFDSEGVATAPKDLVAGGVLRSYVLDSYAGRKLGMATTGNAGGVRNLFVEPGGLDRAGLLREMGSGLLVTELMGQGVNNVTGDYSRGAAGFWVENGEIAFPVEEITIAGNLKDLFRGLQAVGSDLEKRGSFHTGSWLIDHMTIAGD